MKVKYLINVVSLMHIGTQPQRFPGSTFSSPQDLIDEAINIGYDGIQAIPTRGMSGNEENVLLYEDAWNAIETFWGGLRHHMGSEGMPATLTDWIISPSPAECSAVSDRFASRNILKVVHHFGKAGEILEINSKIDLPISEIKQKCQELEMLVCIDTLHLYEYIKERIHLGEYSKKTILKDRCFEAMQTIAKELGDLVTVIHVHSDKKPLKDTIGSWRDGQMFMVVEYFLKLKSPSSQIILVAEYNPGKMNLLRPNKVKEMARQALIDMKKAVKDAESDGQLSGLNPTA